MIPFLREPVSPLLIVVVLVWEDECLAAKICGKVVGDAEFETDSEPQGTLCQIGKPFLGEFRRANSQNPICVETFVARHASKDDVDTKGAELPTVARHCDVTQALYLRLTITVL